MSENQRRDAKKKTKPGYRNPSSSESGYDTAQAIIQSSVTSSYDSSSSSSCSSSSSGYDSSSSSSCDSGGSF